MPHIFDLCDITHVSRRHLRRSYFPIRADLKVKSDVIFSPDQEWRRDEYLSFLNLGVQLGIGPLGLEAIELQRINYNPSLLSSSYLKV
ncbi:MAG: hypothetical protein QF473_05425 [Planctomycetota bacterium]|nr:hypothetical protein [Planctomycetota bacterium]